MRVEIRPYTLEDTRPLWEAVRESLPELKRWMPWCHEHFSIEESGTWLQVQIPAFQAGSEFAFAIVDEGGQYLGACGLNQIDKTNKRANLGYWVRTSATRRGVAATAVGLLRDWGFGNTDLIRLEIVIAVENHPSHGVARKTGAEFEGILRSRLSIHGVMHDAAMYSFTRSS